MATTAATTATTNKHSCLVICKSLETSCSINLQDTTINSPFVTIAPANVIADQNRLIVLDKWTGPLPQQAAAATSTTTEMAIATPTSCSVGPTIRRQRSNNNNQHERRRPNNPPPPQQQQKKWPMPPKQARPAYPPQ
jgi:hypothetical protein